MKNKMLTAALAVAALLSSCAKDKMYKTYTISRPEYYVKQEVKDNARLQAPQALKNAGNFVLYNNTMYICEKDKGIHVYDYSNAANPVNKGFIPIPGNSGLSIKNDVLYADCYSELFVLKIHSNTDVRFHSSVVNTFPARMSVIAFDTNIVGTRWNHKDTTVTEEDYNNGRLMSANLKADNNIFMTATGSSGGTSVGSSLAVFTIVNDYLYAVDNRNLHAFSIRNTLDPVLENSQHVNWNVETIFPFKDRLFIGSMTGMFIYSIANPAAPSYISQFNHTRVCDPVIADDRFAFVTLRSGSPCGGFTNQLDVLNIETVEKPTLIKSYPFSNPHGLSKDGNVLFLCDGNAGLKVIDASDVNNLVLKQTLPIGKAIDVVARDNMAFVMLDNSIRIYTYDQQFNVQLMSSIYKS